MTVPNTQRRAGPFDGNGVTTSFPFTFKVFSTSDIRVVRFFADLSEDLLLGSDYSVTLNGNQDTTPGGSVVMIGGALPVGYRIVVIGNLPYNQTTDLPSGGNFTAAVHENTFDRIVMQIQQLSEVTSRSLVVSEDVTGVDLRLPRPGAGMLIGWNGNGDGLRNVGGEELVTVAGFATWHSQTFNGGSDTFVMSSSPGSIDNLQVFVDGLLLTPELDYSVTGQTITTEQDTPDGTSNVFVRWGQVLPTTETDAMSVTITPSGTGTNSVSLFEFLEHWPINPMSYMSAAQKTSVKAYNFSVDVATPVMAAVNDALSMSRKILFPPGGFLCAGGLDVVVQLADRNRSLIMEGAGYGEPFVMTNLNGTIIKSTSDVPVLKVSSPSMPASAGTLQVRNIAFNANSTSQAVYLKSFYGQGEFCFNKVLQSGTGHGVQIDYMATGNFHDNYILNKDWATFGLGAARVSYGLWLNLQYDAGLQTFTKNTCRGWLTPIRIGQGGGSANCYSARVTDCECSVSYNGIHLTNNSRATDVSHNYCEGGEGGVGLWDEGDYNSITKNFTFAGYGTHLKSDLFTYGGYYAENRLSAGSTPNQTLASITSSSASGGPGKFLVFNTFIFGGSGGSIAGVVAIRKQGTDPRIYDFGNAYNPRGAWTGGAGTAKIVDTSTGGSFALSTSFSRDGSIEMPFLSRGAVSLATEPISLSQTDVASNVLTIPGCASSYNVNASGAATVTSLSLTSPEGRLLMLDLATANMTFQDSASLILAGGASFAGPGLLTLFVKVVGGTTFAKEVSRTLY